MEVGGAGNSNVSVAKIRVRRQPRWFGCLRGEVKSKHLREHSLPHPLETQENSKGVQRWSLGSK